MIFVALVVALSSLLGAAYSSPSESVFQRRPAERGARILRRPDVTNAAAVGLRLTLAPLFLIGCGATIVHVLSA